MILYHTGYQEIRDPDIRFGRKNADFVQEKTTGIRKLIL